MRVYGANDGTRTQEHSLRRHEAIHRFPWQHRRDPDSNSTNFFVVLLDVLNRLRQIFRAVELSHAHHFDRAGRSFMRLQLYEFDPLDLSMIIITSPQRYRCVERHRMQRSFDAFSLPFHSCHPRFLHCTSAYLTHQPLRLRYSNALDASPLIPPLPYLL